MMAFEDQAMRRVLFVRPPWLGIQVGQEERYKVNCLRRLCALYCVDKIDNFLWEFGYPTGFLADALHLKMLSVDLFWEVKFHQFSRCLPVWLF